jgi:hypothetical protein
MEYNAENLKEITTKIQELVFLKSNVETVEEYLKTNNLNFMSLINNLFLLSDNQEISFSITLLEKLILWNEYREELIKILLHLSAEGGNSNLSIISNIKQSVKQFLLKFISKNLTYFYKENFFFELILKYSIDDSSEIYETSINILFLLLSSDINTCTYLNENKIFQSVIENMHQMRSNSIILIRELEVIIKYLVQIKISEKELEEEVIVSKYLKALADEFFNYDLLTQLTFLDTLEKTVTNQFLAQFIFKEINIFKQISYEAQIPDEVIRKFMYSLSKFYGLKFFNTEGYKNIIKNILSVSIQYFQDNKHEISFILSVFHNIFYNLSIFEFLITPENNSQFDFLNSVLEIIIETYANHDPNIKGPSLDLISVIGYFITPSGIQERFYRKFLFKFYQYFNDKESIEEKELVSYFIEKLYKDFKTHDFEEYEFKFLDCLLRKKILKYNFQFNFRFIDL